MHTISQEFYVSPETIGRSTMLKYEIDLLNLQVTEKNQ